MSGPDEDPPPKAADEEDSTGHECTTSLLPENNNSGDMVISSQSSAVLSGDNSLEKMANDESESKIQEKTQAEDLATSSKDEEKSNTSELSTEKDGILDEATTGATGRQRQLVRSLALCGDDDTKLRPPPPTTLQKHPHSLSRDSSCTDYVDSSGLDLKTFIANTLHKNPRDRQMILDLEEQLTNFINDNSSRAFKFPPMSSYNRMMIHRISAVFGLDHNVDNSGKCIVVNKTEKTSIPDFKFSSFIIHDVYTDNKRSLRAFDSHDEGTTVEYVGYDVYLRRAQSYETTNFVPNGSSWVQHPNNHSFDTISTSQQEPWGDRVVYLKKAGSFGGVPAYYRGGHGSLDSPVPPHMAFPANGSGSHSSPREMDALNENMKAVHIDVRAQQARQIPPVASPVRDVVYGPTYQQALYVPASVVPSHQMYSTIPGNMNPNMSMRPVHYAPHMVLGQWNPMPYGYPDTNMVQQPIPMHTVPHAYQQTPPGHIVVHQPMQPQYSSYPMSHSVSVPPPTRIDSNVGTMAPPMTNSRSQQGMMTSVDGGYGSMTQESCRDSEFTQE